MEEFRKNFSLFSSLLSFTALWPYDESLLAKIQRVAISVLYLYLIAIQIWTLRSVEKSLENVIMTLSITCPMVLYFLRYVGFTITRPLWFNRRCKFRTQRRRAYWKERDANSHRRRHRSNTLSFLMKAVFDSFFKDYSATTDPVELGILDKQILVVKRVFVVYLGLTAVLIGYLCVVVLMPTILRSTQQLEYLRILGFHYSEMSWYTDFVSILLIFVNAMGLLSVSCTESATAVSFAYLCGLLEIASCRIEIAINNVITSKTSELIQVQPVVDLHKRAVAIFDDILKELMFSYLIAIVAVIVSFAVNLFRLQLAVQNAQDFASLFLSANDVLLHLVIIYLNNLSVQRVIDTSSYIFNEICSSSWYCIPLRSQKILLFLLMRTTKDIRCNLGGMFDLGHGGFSMMMSTSFSYFTVMCSTQ